MLSSAQNLTDVQLIAGGLLGMIGIFLEGLAFLVICRLMADAAPRSARFCRVSALAYIWLAPIGCHMNIGLLNYAYRTILELDPAIAATAARVMIYAFCVPVWVLLIIFWIPMIVLQFRAFSNGLTPYPRKARWFNLIVGMIPALVLAAIIGPHTALGAGIGTMFLCFGNAFTFGGLLATLPDQERFDRFLEQQNHSDPHTPAP